MFAYSFQILFSFYAAKLKKRYLITKYFVVLYRKDRLLEKVQRELRLKHKSGYGEERKKERHEAVPFALCAP